MTDYATTGLSLKRHPVSLLRDQLDQDKIIPARVMNELPHGRCPNKRLQRPGVWPPNIFRKRHSRDWEVTDLASRAGEAAMQPAIRITQERSVYSRW